MCSTTFTVYFDDPFWVGVLEVCDTDGVRAARHVFGAEPTGPELHAFALSRDYDRLVRQALACPPAGAVRAVPRPTNPKRAARAAARQQAGRPLTTAAQEAMQAALEQFKKDRRIRSRADREAAAEQRRRRAREKARARHRGH